MLPVPFTIDALKSVLGEPSRVANVVDMVYTWDDAGVHAYVKMNSNQVHELNFTLNDPGMTRLQPKSSFPHEIQVGMVPITSATTPADLTPAGFKSKYGIPNEQIKVVGSVYVTVRYDKQTQTRIGEVYFTVPALEFGK